MKKTLLLLSFLIACVHIRSSSATDSIDFQTSASFEKAGHLPVSKLEVFQNKQQLIDYLSKISSDTTELTAVPDFGSESSVAIAYAFVQYYKLRKSIVRILPGDTIVIILHVDSIPLDTSILIGQGYSVNLITIPKTDNPIITKLESFMVLIVNDILLLPEINRYYNIKLIH